MPNLQFDKHEVEAVEEFFKSSVGQKVLKTLDNMADDKNNLLQVVNLASNTFKPEQTGIRCQMSAAEVRSILEIRDLLENFGDNYAD